MSGERKHLWNAVVLISVPGPLTRRRYLRLGAVTALLPIAGCTVAGLRSDEDEMDAEYQSEDEIVYEHGDLELDLLQEPVHIGETVEFEVTNTGESEVSLGCQNPWALQRQSDGEWRHITWTGEDYYKLCATLLSPDSTVSEEIPLSNSGLAQQAEEVQTEIRPGQYRFILLGPSPFVALDFTVRASG